MKKKEERNLQQIQTEKFSDVSVLVRSLLPLERRTITAYNLLVFMLKSKTADFDSKQKLSIALNHAYGMKEIGRASCRERV